MHSYSTLKLVHEAIIVGITQNVGVSPLFEDSYFVLPSLIGFFPFVNQTMLMFVLQILNACMHY
jgi:hypothetical protein